MRVAFTFTIKIKILKNFSQYQIYMFWGDEFKIVNETYSSFFKFYDLVFTSNSAYTQNFQNSGSQMLILWEIALSRI